MLQNIRKQFSCKAQAQRVYLKVSEGLEWMSPLVTYMYMYLLLTYWEATQESTGFEQFEVLFGWHVWGALREIWTGEEEGEEEEKANKVGRWVTNVGKTRRNDQHWGKEHKKIVDFYGNWQNDKQAKERNTNTLVDYKVKTPSKNMYHVDLSGVNSSWNGN